MPPPPPNQVIYATYPAGLTTRALPTLLDYGALTNGDDGNDTATAAYAMEVTKIRMYTEEDDRRYQKNGATSSIIAACCKRIFIVFSVSASICHK